MKTQKNTSNLMSKIALLSLLFFFVGITTTFAQKNGGDEKDDNSTPTEKAEKRSQKWKTELNLNDTQTSQLKKILIKQITATEALRGEERGEKQKAKMDEIMAKLNTEVETIFTEKQYEAYKKRNEEQR